MATDKKKRAGHANKKRTSDMRTVGPARPDGVKNVKHGIEHLIECTCVLPQYLNHDTPIFHKFVVFSIITENGEVEEKYVQCNNCGTVHRVYDICKSDVKHGRELSMNIMGISDIKLSLDERIVDQLDAYKCDVAKWEHVKFIIDEQRWGERITLSSEMIDGKRIGKVATVLGPNRLGVTTFSENVDFETN